MSDSYYELIDESDSNGERFAATDLVRSTWSAAIQHGAPVSALLVRDQEVRMFANTCRCRHFWFARSSAANSAMTPG